jgi:hypothetical protein
MYLLKGETRDRIEMLARAVVYAELGTSDYARILDVDYVACQNEVLSALCSVFST